ncbi:MAG TPA: hypothetical protein VGN81_13935 [Pseudonocardiaceae bacterium]|jgi:hypothetical protein
MIDQLPSYSVVVSREDNLWVAIVDGLPAGATDVEKFEELDDAVHDLIASLVDVEPDTFWIDWRYRLGTQDLTVLIENLREWEHRAEQATRHRDATRKAVVDSMRSAGLSYREIADVVGLSHQRIGQLVAEGDSAPAQPPDRLHEFVDARLARRVRDPEAYGLGGDVPSPVESALVALLASIRRVRPDSRGELLSGTASVLADAATDKEFLGALS